MNLKKSAFLQIGLFSIQNSVILSRFLIFSRLFSMKLLARLTFLIEISPLVSLIIAILLLLRSRSSNDARLLRPSKIQIKLLLRLTIFKLMHFSSLSIFLILFEERSMVSKDCKSPSPYILSIILFLKFKCLSFSSVCCSYNIPPH